MNAFVGSCFTFQSAAEIDKALTDVVWPGKYLDILDQFSCDFLVDDPDRMMHVRTIGPPGRWRGSLDRLFKCRHRLVHDANWPSQLSQEEVKALETTVVFICYATAVILKGHVPVSMWMVRTTEVEACRFTGTWRKGVRTGGKSSVRKNDRERTVSGVSDINRDFPSMKGKGKRKIPPVPHNRYAFAGSDIVFLK